MVKHRANKKMQILTDKMLKMLISIWLIKKIILILRLLSSVVKVIKIKICYDKGRNRK